MTFIQRFGAALNLNVHLYLLVLDGAYTFAGYHPRFHRTLPPTDGELERRLPSEPPRVAPARDPPLEELDQTLAFDPADPEPVPEYEFDVRREKAALSQWV